MAAIVESSGDAIMGVTNDGMITSWNTAAEALFGYSAAEIVGTPISVLAPGALVAEQVQMRAVLTAGGPAQRLETTRRRKDGSLVEVVLTASPIVDEAGTVVGLSMIAHDITRRRDDERALEASQRQLAEAQQIAHVGSFEHDLVTGVRTRSEEFFRILGIKAGFDASDDFLISMVHPDDRDIVRDAWVAAKEHGLNVDVGARMIRADDELRVVRLRMSAEAADDGTIIKVIGTLMDDTDRVNAVEVQRTAEARFEVGFEQAAIGTAILDLDWVPSRVNPAICRLLGQTAVGLAARPWGNLDVRRRPAAVGAGRRRSRDRKRHVRR